jgi:hypothetical protein
MRTFRRDDQTTAFRSSSVHCLNDVNQLKEINISSAMVYEARLTYLLLVIHSPISEIKEEGALATTRRQR